MKAAPIASFVVSLALAPLLPGIIARTKAFFAGRRGAPLLQPYFDLAKLMRKGAAYSRTTTAVFRAGPVASLAAVALALAIVPVGGAALVAFPGDFFLLACLLGLARFATVLAALDTGSSFEGMGASREVQFAVFAEPALLVGLAALARKTQAYSLDAMYAGVGASAWASSSAALALIAAAFLVVYLAENARIPVDDPNTHLELTMIHEVMVLDHGGPDFALISYGAALKLWLLGALVSGLLVPVRTGVAAIDIAAGVAGLLALAVITGVIESTLARLRLLRVPHLLAGACAFALLAFILVLQ
jgi:formate hydrogenlyase subunit 4